MGCAVVEELGIGRQAEWPLMEAVERLVRRRSPRHQVTSRVRAAAPVDAGAGGRAGDCRAAETDPSRAGGDLVALAALATTRRSETPAETAERLERARFARPDALPPSQDGQRCWPAGSRRSCLYRDPRGSRQWRSRPAGPRRSGPDRDPRGSHGNPGRPRASAWARRPLPLVSIYTGGPAVSCVILHYKPARRCLETAQAVQFQPTRAVTDCLLKTCSIFNDTIMTVLSYKRTL